jgi:hypothetical protein
LTLTLPQVQEEMHVTGALGEHVSHLRQGYPKLSRLPSSPPPHSEFRMKAKMKCGGTGVNSVEAALFLRKPTSVVHRRQNASHMHTSACEQTDEQILLSHGVVDREHPR